MTREETAKLLQSLVGAYPDTFIKDAKATLDIWCMHFAEEDAGTVYKATRLYMLKGKKFPTPADILKLLSRASFYDVPQKSPELPSGALGLPDVDDDSSELTGCDLCPYKDWADSPSGCHREHCIA